MALLTDDLKFFTSFPEHTGFVRTNCKWLISANMKPLDQSCVYLFIRRLFNTIQDGSCRGCSRKEGELKGPLPKICYISYNDETWHSHTLPKEDVKKNLNHVTHSLISADISIFSLEISHSCYIKKYRYRLHFNTWFQVLTFFFESVKVLFNKHGCNFDDFSKISYSRPS